MNQDEICEHCGGRYGRWYPNQRFCSKSCNTAFQNEERRQALAAWRAKQEQSEGEQGAAA